MNLSNQILSDIVVHMKYSRYLPKLNRRETWNEIVDRNKNMHLERFPTLSKDIEGAYRYVYDKQVLPSMRALQFSGKPILVNNSRQYNCSYLPINHPDSFSEILFLLLSGTGVGISVRKEHVQLLPRLKKPFRNRGKKKRYLIGDSIEGWADSIKVLVESYFFGKQEVDFDFRDIRPKGSQLITSGGKAPGPEPLRVCIASVQSILEDTLSRGGFLRPIDAHDIACHLADAVLAGGIRRAAMISLFSPDDSEMLEAKTGNWWETNPQRGRANNSAVFVRSEVTREQYDHFFDYVQNSGSGEPGIYWTNDANGEYGTNPCCETSLQNNSMCNLTEVNTVGVNTQSELNARVKAATLIGTLQASYTDFHYLRDIWRQNQEEDALLGVSLTGIASGNLDSLNLREASQLAIETNRYYAGQIGINPSKRITTIKPSGTAATVLGSSSGIHAWFSPHYIRRIRVGKNEAIYTYLKLMHPELIEDEFFRPETQAVISVPQKAPKGAIMRSETAIKFLNRIRKYNLEWIAPGSLDGPNHHNVSATVFVKDHEWDDVREWLWSYRGDYHGVAILPYDGGSYQQAPFEEIDEERYNELYNSLIEVDLSLVIEDKDMTDLQGEAACGGGSCEIV